jgi:hypothetical protein
MCSMQVAGVLKAIMLCIWRTLSVYRAALSGVQYSVHMCVSGPNSMGACCMCNLSQCAVLHQGRMGADVDVHMVITAYVLLRTPVVRSRICLQLRSMHFTHA